MTEKRFELRNPKIDYTIQCEEISDNKNWITYGEIVDLLNYLLEENEQLKQQIKDMKIRFKRKYDHDFDEIIDELW